MAQTYTRRRFLSTASGTAALVAALEFMPPNVQRILSEPLPTPATRHQIEHVVLLMQENRSFDHYFGTLSGVCGFGDLHALRRDDGYSVFHQPDPEHPEKIATPFHLDTYSHAGQRIPSTSHAWEVQHASLNGGKMDNWLPAHRRVDGNKAPYVMGYYTRKDIPFHFALADAFTICDHYHCSVLGPTWPNRMMWMTGTIDPLSKGNGPIIWNTVPLGGYTWTTYAQRLEKAGVSWKVFVEDDGHEFNVLKTFQQFRSAPRSSPLYAKGIASSPHGTFEEMARDDSLPTVSWIMPRFAESEHPDSRPARGADFIASKINAIAENPRVWAKTVFILNYDENDGIFDHVVPPLPPPGEPLEFVHNQPIGAGFRVPCIIVSPWTTGGWVANENFDHTSVLQFLEWFTGVQEPNISPWRRKTFGNLTSAFRFNDTSYRPYTFPGTSEEVTRVINADCRPLPAIPRNIGRIPTQEAGEKRKV